jgi:PKD repeat protein
MEISKFTLLLLALIIFFLIVPIVQATDYAALKTAYINSHPGQTIIPFPWESGTSIKVLPFNYEIPAVPGNIISISACRDEFEAASFIITSQKDLSGIGITVQPLKDGNGNTIPSSAIDVRLVKVWYQAAPNNIYYTTAGYYLTPELLLKDDSLVNVDYVNKTNYLKVTINGVQQYIDISNSTGAFPSNAQVQDASSLQPFSLKANENKQIWITVHVPRTTPGGNYSGTLIITAPSETPVTMNFSVTVLPFDLEPAPLEYGIYYLGEMTFASLNGYDKNPATMFVELQDMKDHGVVYPTLYQKDDANLNSVLTLRDTIGLPKDKIYIAGLYPSHNAYIGNPTDPAGLQAVANKVINWRGHTESHGYTTTYFYGIDEAWSDVLATEIPAWQTVHNNGGKMFVAVDNNYDAVNVVGDLLDLAVFFGPHTTAQVAQWHSKGKRIFSYGNPHVGVENPEIYRKNYGFTLWYDGYDGSMDFAYQNKFGQSIWNDFDTPPRDYQGTIYYYRDHVFAYPATNGVIDTIQWEGFREGVDDTRYVASLIKKDGSTVSAKALVSAGISNNDNMTAIRKNVIAQVLLSNPAAPIANFTASPLSGTAPLTVTFTDTSTNSPTFWNWSFGDGSFVNATVRNPIHTYTAAGNYTVVLNVTSAGGFGTLTRQRYINITNAMSTFGVFRPSTHMFYLDYNRIGVWNGAGIDRLFNFGITGDIPVSGDWNADGRTEIGVFRNSTDQFYLDYTGNGTWNGALFDQQYTFGLSGDIPISGDWNADGRTEIGVFRNSTHQFYLDYNGNGAWNGALFDQQYTFGLSGDIPISGDWNADRRTEIGVFRPSNHVFYLDYNGNGLWEGAMIDRAYTFGLSGDIPVSGDWNADGKTEIGVFRNSTHMFYLDYHGNGAWNGASVDRLYNFGISGDVPVSGKW